MPLNVGLQLPEPKAIPLQFHHKHIHYDWLIFLRLQFVQDVKLLLQTQLETLNFTVGDGLRIDHRHNVICSSGFDIALRLYQARPRQRTQQGEGGSQATQPLPLTAKAEECADARESLSGVQCK